VRRSWRFGQANPVAVDIISTKGQENVFRNLRSKAAAADKMFDHLVALMRDELIIRRVDHYTSDEEVPVWL